MKPKQLKILTILLTLFFVSSCVCVLVPQVKALGPFAVTLQADGNGEITSRDVFDNNNMYGTYNSLTVTLPDVDTQFQALPNTGYKFSEFLITSPGSPNRSTQSNPVGFGITGTFTILAEFTPITPTPTPNNPEIITVINSPYITNSGTFISDLTSGINSPAITGNGSFTGSQGDQMLVSPFIYGAYEFANFTITNGGSLNTVTTSNAYFFTLSNSLTLTTNFQSIYNNGGHNITVEIYGPGEIYYGNNPHTSFDGSLLYNASAPNINMQNVTLYIDDGVTERFFAMPDLGYQFDHYLIVGNVNYNGTQTGASIPINVTDNFIISAYFVPSTTYLQISMSPNVAGLNSTTEYISLTQGTNYLFTAQLVVNSIDYTGIGNYTVTMTELSTYYGIDYTEANGLAPTWTTVLTNVPMVGGIIQFNLNAVSGYSQNMYQGIFIDLSIGNNTGDLLFSYTFIWQPLQPQNNSYLKAFAFLWSLEARLIYGCIALIGLMAAFAWLLRKSKDPTNGIIIGAVAALIMNITLFAWSVWSLFVVVLLIIYLLVKLFMQGS